MYTVKQNYSDIMSRIKDDPAWWDANGVPRWCDYHPSSGASIYATESALVEIACQACFKIFLCEVSWDQYTLAWTGKKFPSLSEDLEGLAYGDPPNMGCCPAGPTMTSVSLRVHQFWARENGMWKRQPQNEIEIQKLENYFKENSHERF